MGLPRRKFFRRHHTMVAVVRIPLGGGNHVEPGTEFAPGDLRLHRMQSWYRRGFLGVKDDDWTFWALERLKGKVERDIAKTDAPPGEDQVSLLDYIRSAMGFSERGEEQEG